MSKAADLANLIGNINMGGGGVNRNVIINGAMNVYQRGSDTIDHDGTTSGYVLDRFKLDTSGMDELHLTVTQDSSVPSGQGFANSMKVDITTAESALASDEYIRILHGIEAQNLQLLNYGTSDAKTITLSFWVRSNLTSTFAVSIYQPDDDRIINSTYSISSADTWEKKTITFEGDTTGVIDDDNGAGFYINFALGTGSDRTGTASSSWSAFANAKMFNGQVANITSSASNDFYLTGVQLEIGQNPTEFEHEPFAVTFEKCKRYYFKWLANSTHDVATDAVMHGDTYAFGHYYLSPMMRGTPTFSSGGSFAANIEGADRAISSLQINTATSGSSVNFYGTTPDNNEAGKIGLWRANNDDDAYLEFISEL
tara:strand:+ start:1243 stop:2349 length:1107 start_codon:yes stop_codon:yes gene_type:complete